MNNDFADECPNNRGCQLPDNSVLVCERCELSTLMKVNLKLLFQPFDSRFLFSVIAICQHPELFICDLAKQNLFTILIHVSS